MSHVERKSILDPPLTETGIWQAKSLCSTLGARKTITHVLCSPLVRTIKTAVVGLRPLLDNGLKIIAYPDLREWGSSPCSTGTPISVLFKVCGEITAGEIALTKSSGVVAHS